MRILFAALVIGWFPCFCLAAEETFQLRPYTRHLSFSAFTRPIHELVLASEVSGTCKEILVDVGAAVSSDGVVARIDSFFVNLDLEKNTISQKQVQRQLELERKTVARYRALLQSSSTAQATFDEAALQAQIYELTLTGLQKEAQRLSELLRRHTLSGPAGWLVIERFAEPGSFIHQGEPVLRLGDFSRLQVPFLLTSEEIELLINMKDITLFLPDQRRRTTATIWRISPVMDEKSRKIAVDLVFDQAIAGDTTPLRGGERVHLVIQGGIEDNSYVVPSTALISRYEAHWLVAEDGNRIMVILLGMSDDKKNAVITGNTLNMQQKFIISPELSQPADADQQPR